MSINESLNFKITNLSDKEKRKPTNLKILTLSKLHEWIDSHTFDASIKKILKEMASTYPQTALPVWKKNFLQHLAKAQKKASDLPREELTDSISTELGIMPLDNEFDPI
jgi:hypothetical protein